METRGPAFEPSAFLVAGLLVIAAPANTKLLSGERLAAPAVMVEVPNEDELAAPAKTTFILSEDMLAAPAMALLDPLCPGLLVAAPDRAVLTWPVPVLLIPAIPKAPAAGLVAAPAPATLAVGLAAVPATARPVAAPFAAASGVPGVFMPKGEPVFP